MQILKTDILRLKSEIAAIRLSRAIQRACRSQKYSLDQPRVPAGSPDGGQWANGDGSRHEYFVVPADRTSIIADPRKGPRWDERYRVKSPDGTTTIFENRDGVQTVLDSEGRILSRTQWTPEGPQAVAFPQPAFLAPPAVAAGEQAVTGALALYTWLSGRNSDSQQAVLGFVSRDYQRDPLDTSGDIPYVGMLTRDNTEAACPRLPEVQKMADDAAKGVDRDSYATAATYGTAVHKRLADEIRTLDDPNLRSEVSFLKIADETNQDPFRYGLSGSIRIDVLEAAEDRTTCVYDIKTGAAGLSLARTREITDAVYSNFPRTQRIIVTEVRPR